MQEGVCMGYFPRRGGAAFLESPILYTVSLYCMLQTYCSLPVLPFCPTPFVYPDIILYLALGPHLYCLALLIPIPRSPLCSPTSPFSPVFFVPMP